MITTDMYTFLSVILVYIPIFYIQLTQYIYTIYDIKKLKKYPKDGISE
jgi:hypothetical protein